MFGFGIKFEIGKLISDNNIDAALNAAKSQIRIVIVKKLSDYYRDYKIKI